MRGLKYAAVLAAALGAAGCASLDYGECRRADWRAIGARDGEHGEPDLQLARHREACGRYGMPPDEAAWVAGHREGLAAYCTPAGGYRAGRRGERYQGVCESAGLFLPAFERGSQVGALHGHVRALADSVQQLQIESGSADPAQAERARREELEVRRRYDELRAELAQVDARASADYGTPSLVEDGLPY
ncbi:MAG TPA: DUF2799 domain-containing protein [Candidatus Binatia bacterium]|nr:DUF2799 domain-containing protein [Candidatus Binatia bacterium]